MLSRRDFLALAGGIVVVAACGSDDDGASSGNTIAPESDEEFTDLSPAVLSSDLYASETPQRFAFALTAKQGYASQGTVAVAFAPSVDGQSVVNADQLTPTTLHEAGLPQNRGVYVVETVFDREGIWDAIADRDGEQLPFAVQVKAKADAPTVGAAAPADPSPTPADAARRRSDLHSQPGVPATRSFARHPRRGRVVRSRSCSRHRLAARRSTADRCSTACCRSSRRTRTASTSCTSTSSRTCRPTRRRRRSPRGGSRANRGCSAIDAAGVITARLDGAFGQDEMRTMLELASA